MRSAIRTVEKRCEMMTAMRPATSSRKAHEDLVLGARVERRRRLVEDEHLRVAHVGAGERDLLPLAAREIDAALEAAAEHLPIARAEARQQRRRERLLGRRR